MKGLLKDHYKWIGRMIKRKEYYEQRRKTRINEAKRKAEKRIPEKLHEEVLPGEKRKLETI